MTLGLPWSDPDSDPVGDLLAFVERQQQAYRRPIPKTKVLRGARVQFVTRDEIIDLTPYVLDIMLTGSTHLPVGPVRPEPCRRRAPQRSLLWLTVR